MLVSERTRVSQERREHLVMSPVVRRDIFVDHGPRGCHLQLLDTLLDVARFELLLRLLRGVVRGRPQTAGRLRCKTALVRLLLLHQHPLLVRNVLVPLSVAD